MTRGPWIEEESLSQQTIQTRFKIHTHIYSPIYFLHLKETCYNLSNMRLGIFFALSFTFFSY